MGILSVPVTKQTEALRRQAAPRALDASCRLGDRRLHRPRATEQRLPGAAGVVRGRPGMLERLKDALNETSISDDLLEIGRGPSVGVLVGTTAYLSPRWRAPRVRFWRGCLSRSTPSRPQHLLPSLARTPIVDGKHATGMDPPAYNPPINGQGSARPEDERFDYLIPGRHRVETRSSKGLPAIYVHGAPEAVRRRGLTNPGRRTHRAGS